MLFDSISLRWTRTKQEREKKSLHYTLARSRLPIISSFAVSSFPFSLSLFSGRQPCSAPTRTPTWHGRRDHINEHAPPPAPYYPHSARKEHPSSITASLATAQAESLYSSALLLRVHPRRMDIRPPSPSSPPPLSISPSFLHALFLRTYFNFRSFLGSTLFVINISLTYTEKMCRYVGNKILKKQTSRKMHSIFYDQ